MDKFDKFISKHLANIAFVITFTILINEIAILGAYAGWKIRWMVCIIYVIVVGQFINSRPTIKGNGTRRGNYFYKMSGIINLIIGFVGMIAVNLLLRDKGIIPEPFVWTALIGFFFVVIYGLYCIYKMLTCVDP